MIHLAECLFCLLLTIPPRPGEPAGRPPPEVAGRVPYPDRTVAFDQAGDWTVQADGVDASTWLTVAHPLWAPQSLAVRLNGAGGSLRLTPPAPVPLPAGWDTATVWYDLWNDTWRRTIAGPFAPRLVLLLRDETDETHAVPFPELRSAGVWRHWNLFQTPRNPPLWATPARLGDQGDVGQETAIAGTRSAQGGDRNGRLDGSSWLVGLTLVLAGRELGEPITVYLDSLSFHTAPPAKPEVAPPVPGLLDQPLAPPADLPATARYDYRPIRGTLDDLIVDCGGRTFRPLAGGGVTFGQPVGPPERLEAKEAAGEWLSRWRYRAVGEEEIVTFRVRPRGGALIVEVDGTTGLANGLSASEPRKGWSRRGGWTSRTWRSMARRSSAARNRTCSWTMRSSSRR